MFREARQLGLVSGPVRTGPWTRALILGWNRNNRGKLEMFVRLEKQSAGDRRWCELRVWSGVVVGLC